MDKGGKCSGRHMFYMSWKSHDHEPANSSWPTLTLIGKENGSISQSVSQSLLTLFLSSALPKLVIVIVCVCVGHWCWPLVAAVQYDFQSAICEFQFEIQFRFGFGFGFGFWNSIRIASATPNDQFYPHRPSGAQLRPNCT